MHQKAQKLLKHQDGYFTNPYYSVTCTGLEGCVPDLTTMIRIYFLLFKHLEPGYLDDIFPCWDGMKMPGNFFQLFNFLCIFELVPLESNGWLNLVMKDPSKFLLLDIIKGT